MPKSARPSVEGGRDERDEAEHGDEHEQPVGVLAGERQQRRQAEVERVRRRRERVLEAGRHPVQQVAAPDEVVVGVVVGIRRHERPRRDGDEREGGERRALPHGSGAAAGSAAPSASSAHASGSSRKAAYSSVCTTSATNAAATAARAIERRAPRSSVAIAMPTSAR